MFWKSNKVIRYEGNKFSKVHRLRGAEQHPHFNKFKVLRDEKKKTRRFEGLKNSLLTLISHPSIPPYIHTSCKSSAVTMAEQLSHHRHPERSEGSHGRLEMLRHSLSMTIAFTMADRRSSAIEQRAECRRHTTRFLRVEQDSRFHILGCKLAFTMAEILISLTIIGIIAAITLPSLQANINEKTWATQRKALYSRMSQAISMMPSLNGYGEYEGSWSADSVTVTKDTAAQAFVTDGLSKVLQITNICPVNKLKDCGIPDKITVMGTNGKIEFPANLTELNPMFTNTHKEAGVDYYNPQRSINTNATAFETKNGESVAVFYNPYCQPADMDETDSHYSQPKMCANFIYDLNGRKGPNKVGKDIGFITAMYSTDSEIVAPIPLEQNAKDGNSNTMQQTSVAAACRTQDENSRAPNIEELTAMFYNKKLLGIPNGAFWSGSVSSPSTAWFVYFSTGNRSSRSRSAYSYRVRCIKR